MHTVFTDGRVWPTVRVQEAWREGLDAFAFTEHLEILPFKDDVKPNVMRPHEIAKGLAAEQRLTLIEGAEITRGTPPGHFNALFITNGSKLISERGAHLDQACIDRAAEQNAFIFWNHPGWQKNRTPESYDWLPFIEKQYQDKKLHGIEVANGFSIYTKAIDWALDRNLTILANTDVHGVVGYDYDLNRPDGHRTMTLVFAKDTTPQAIREALEAGRTVAWAGKYLIGKEENVKGLVEASLKLAPAHFQKTGRSKVQQDVYELSNPTGLYFELELVEGDATDNIILPPHQSILISANSGQSKLRYKVANTLIRSDKNFVLEVNLTK